jgi:hypothetical protein
MGWRVRKSVSVAGVRLNFGKSGLTSVSTGVRGFRVTTGKQGTRVTVGIPGTGISYTERIGQKAPRDHSQPIAVTQNDVQLIQSADVEQLTDVSSEELLNRINKAAGQFHYAILVGVVVLLALYPVWLVSEIAVIPFMVLGAFAVWWTYGADTRRRTTHLHYDLDTEVAKQHEDVRSAVAQLAIAQAMWRVISHQSADWKHHGGASSLVQRYRSLVNKVKPPCISTNIEIPSIDANGVKVFFFPDQILVWQSGKYGAVPYRGLSVQVGSTRFVEDGWVPSDASVVGNTWMHPNRNGGPDRRFANNRQLPIPSMERLN